jgi:uncharacterized protein (TIGR00255 family)
MIQSMTGYGQSSCEMADKIVTVEIRSLNSKQLDLYFRMPSVYRDKEIDVRSILNAKLKRGKIEVCITVEYKEERPPVRLNAPVIKYYYRQLKEILGDLAVTDEPVMQAVLRLPEAINPERTQDDAEEWQKVKACIMKAAEGIDNFRSEEGNSIADDLLKRIDIIDAYLISVSGFEKKRMETITQRLHSSLTELIQPEKIDKNRFEQELIYYIEKIDITEEKNRLAQHCRYFRQVMSDDEQAGRKLGFIAQEIGREINTIGSKANDADIQRLVVLMKDELEKIKEQLMNIL